MCRAPGSTGQSTHITSDYETNLHTQSACEGVCRLVSGLVAAAGLSHSCNKARTRCRQRAHDVQVKSIGRAGDSRRPERRGRRGHGRGLDGRRVGAVPIGRSLDGTARGLTADGRSVPTSVADRRKRLSFCPSLGLCLWASPYPKLFKLPIGWKPPFLIFL